MTRGICEVLQRFYQSNKYEIWCSHNHPHCPEKPIFPQNVIKTVLFKLCEFFLDNLMGFLNVLLAKVAGKSRFIVVVQ